MSHRTFFDEDLPNKLPSKTIILCTILAPETSRSVFLSYVFLRVPNLGFCRFQTMCQGHEDLAQPAAEPSLPSTPSGDQSQSDLKKQQKLKIKQQKQKNAKQQTPPAEPPLPTHELIKNGSAKLANGTR